MKFTIDEILVDTILRVLSIDTSEFQLIETKRNGEIKPKPLLRCHVRYPDLSTNKQDENNPWPIDRTDRTRKILRDERDKA